MSEHSNFTEEKLQDTILRHLKATGTINALIAAKEYGTNDLRDQIYQLRKRLKKESAGKPDNVRFWIKTSFHKSPLKNERYSTYTLMLGNFPYIKRSCAAC